MFTSLTNSLMLAEITRHRTGTCALYTQRRLFSKYLLSCFLRDFLYTRWSHAHTFCDDEFLYYMHDGNGCTLNLYVEHCAYCLLCQWSLEIALRARLYVLPNWGVVWVPSNQAFYRWWGGGQNDSPTNIKWTNKNTQSKFDPYLWTCDVSLPPLSGRLSSSPSTQVLL